MIKNIIIAIFVLLVTFFVVFANIKATEAEKQRALAMANLELVEIHRKAAESAEMEATRLAAEKLMTQRKLDECLGTK